MKINLYQVNIERDTEHRAFRDTKELEHFLGSSDIKSEAYDKVFEGDVDCRTLEDVFRKFNLDRPDGYRGRSLSVSDIVEVKESPDVQKGFYFCNDIGFQKVIFAPDKAQDITKDDKIAVLFIAVGEAPKVVYITPNLEEMQRLVGGYIEEYMPFDDDVAIVCNEEGKINGSPLNRAIYDESDGKKGPMIDIIAGNFFLANAPYESENFESLTPDMIQKYTKRFRYPESFMKLGNEIVVVPIKPVSRGQER